jgi:transcriptional regulator with XRE-family HTH domain
MGKIYVPDVLPNNLRVIREMRGISLKDAAEGISVDRNFLSGVEQETKNFSGKTMIKTLMFYNINFYRMFDVQEKRSLDVTDDFPIIICKSLRLNKESLNTNFINIDEKFLSDNAFFVSLKEQIINEFKTKEKDLEYKITDKRTVEECIEIDIEFSIAQQQKRTIEFDINFTANENSELVNLLNYKSFNDGIVTFSQLVDNKNVYIKDNFVYFDTEFKIPRANDINDYYVTNKLSLDEVEIKDIKDYVREKTFTYVRFKAIRQEINNLKFLRTITNTSIDELRKMLGLSYNIYLNLELGNQKLSTKTAWRLVSYFKVPLELIINIDEYYFRNCKYE